MDIYNSGEYLEKNPEWGDDEAEAKFGPVKEMLSRHLPSVAQNGRLKILDIGCGSAGISYKMAADLGKSLDVRVDAYDVSPQACEIAKGKYGDERRLNIRQGTLDDVPEKDYDLITCFDVIEHVYDYEGFLRSLKERASYVLFNVPIEINLLAIFRPNAFKETYLRGGHINFYNHEYFVFLLERLGFTIVDTAYSDAFKHVFKTKRAYLVYPFRILAGLFSRKIAAALLGGYSLMVLTSTGRA